MRLMHTKLSDFIAGIKNAAIGSASEKPVRIRGLENVRTGKVQSLRAGRIMRAVEEAACHEDTTEVEVVILPRVPETMHTVIVKSIGKDGAPTRAVLESLNILQPTEDVELQGCINIDDRRPPLGKH